MKFVPNNFKPRWKDIEWAIIEFNINQPEVMRQFELMKDYEFHRSYTDWNRVFRNWMRKANEIQTLKREHQYSNTQSNLTEEEQEKEAKRGQENLDRLMRLVK